MYIRTKIADGLYVTEVIHDKLITQHIIESKEGFIIRVIKSKHFSDIRITACLCTPNSFESITTINLPVGTYSSLRAALKLLAKMSKLHRRPQYA